MERSTPCATHFATRMQVRSVAAGATLEDLLFRFGHTDSGHTLRAHYAGRYSKAEAAQFFALRPSAWRTPARFPF